MSKLLSSIEAHLNQRPEQSKLTQTSRLTELEPGEIQDTIRGLYKSKDLNGWLLARILNSIFTQKRGVFLLSRPILQDLIKRDKNKSKRKTINGDEYKELMVNLDKKFLRRLAHGVKGERRSAVYELVHPELVRILKSMIPEASFDVQRKQCLELFNSYGKNSQDNSKKTSSATATANEFEDEGDFASEPVTQEYPLSFSELEEKPKEEMPSWLVDQADQEIKLPVSSDDVFEGEYWLRPSTKSKARIPYYRNDLLKKLESLPPVIGGSKETHEKFADALIEIVFGSSYDIFNDWDELCGRYTPSRDEIADVVKMHLKIRFRDKGGDWSYEGPIATKAFNTIMERYDSVPQDRQYVVRRYCIPTEWQVYSKVRAAIEEREYHKNLGELLGEPFDPKFSYTPDEFKVYEKVKKTEEERRFSALLGMEQVFQLKNLGSGEQSEASS